jgi:signal transduction histidine kinase
MIEISDEGTCRGQQPDDLRGFAAEFRGHSDGEGEGGAYHAAYNAQYESDEHPKKENDEIMQAYISATESTAMRLKQLSEDMFKYSLAFGDTGGMITMEEYDAFTLFDQMLSEHIVLMREMGYDVETIHEGDAMPDGSVVVTDAQNLMRIVDNIFSNLRKYADPDHPILVTVEVKGDKMILECQNKVKKDTGEAESNGIGLKTCSRLASLVADKFTYGREGDYFTCSLSLRFRQRSVLDADVPDFLIGE